MNTNFMNNVIKHSFHGPNTRMFNQNERNNCINPMLDLNRSNALN